MANLQTHECAGPTLRAFTCGWFTQPLSFFLRNAGDTPVRAPVPAYLVEHPKGMALFDTGFAQKMRVLYGAGHGLELTECDDVATRLIAAAVDPAQIRWIVNSHFHVDHCGGNSQIPNATVIVQRAELEAARAGLGSPLYDWELFDTGQPVLAIDGEHDVFGDGSVVVFPTLGHTPGHQSLRVRLPRGDVILAGDCCYLKQSLDELRTSSGDDDPEQALATLRHLHALRAKGTRIFYGHDGDFWRSVPQGEAIN